MNGYICVYKGKQLKLHCDTAARAQEHAAKHFKAKLADVSVFNLDEAVRLLTDLRNYETAVRTTISSLKQQNLAVYGPEVLTDRVWFTKDDRIGCAQFDGQYWTVHKPCKYNGTGFGVKTTYEALGNVSPVWFTKVVPEKYKDFNEFNEAHKFVQY